MYSKIIQMNKILSFFVLFSIFLIGCDQSTGPYQSHLPGIWKIEKAHGPHADEIRGGYIEFSEEGEFIWSTKKNVVTGSYEDFENHFSVQYDGHEVKKRFDYRFSGGFLVIIPEISGQKFFLKKVD